LVVLVASGTVSAAVLKYDATVRLTWRNGGFASPQVTIDDDAKVVVDYKGGGVFDIVSISFDTNAPDVGTLALHAVGGSGGVIEADGTAKVGQLGFAGRLFGVNTHDVGNTGADWSGTMTGPGGTRFAPGDVFTLRNGNNAGNLVPGFSGNTNWDLLGDSNKTRIQFNAITPDPASFLIFAAGCVLATGRRPRTNAALAA
jgi:hypothetical protein